MQLELRTHPYVILNWKKKKKKRYSWIPKSSTKVEVELHIYIYSLDVSFTTHLVHKMDFEDKNLIIYGTSKV